LKVKDAARLLLLQLNSSSISSAGCSLSLDVELEGFRQRGKPELGGQNTSSPRGDFTNPEAGPSQ